MVASIAVLDKLPSPAFGAACPPTLEGANPPVACAGSLQDYVVRALGLVKLLERIDDDRR